jgi:hypothetical protein
MTRGAAALMPCLFVVAVTVSAQEHEAHGSAIMSTPQWEQVKALAGEWDGYVLEGEKRIPTKASIRLTGDGSAVMHWLDSGSPHEMITMFHMDHGDLLATHYCSAHNQPRFKAVPGGNAARIAFEFKDGTNIHPGDGYMKRLVVVVLDPDHHDEEWTFDAKGVLGTATFHMTRVTERPPDAR